MKVLFVYKLLTMGGVETVLRARLESLPQFGIEAHAWFLFDGPGRVIFEDMSERFHVGSTGLLRQFLTHEHFDMVSSIDTEEIFPVLRRLRKKPALVIEVHTPYEENMEYLRFVGDLPVAAYFVPSEYQLQVIQKRVGVNANIQVIPNPLASSFEGEISDFSPGLSKPIIAWIGRLDDLKNWKEFIQIGQSLEGAKAEVEYWIVGRSGGEEISQDLYKQARRAGVLRSLRWYRGLPYAQIPRLLDAVRSSGGIVVSTSKGDSFGMTVAEAMARACAVLVPHQGPFGEFVEEGLHGEMYHVGNPKEAATKILGLIDDPQRQRRLGLQAREHILKRHGVSAAMDKLTKTLTVLIDTANKIRI